MFHTRLKEGLVLDRISLYNSKISNAETNDIIEIKCTESKTPHTNSDHIRNKTTIILSKQQSREDANPVQSGQSTDTTLLSKDIKSACLIMLNNLGYICDRDLDAVTGISLSINVIHTDVVANLSEIGKEVISFLRIIFGGHVELSIHNTTSTLTTMQKTKIQLSPTIFITNELAKKLDLRDAKELCKTLTWLIENKLTAFDSQIVTDITEATSLESLHKVKLYQCIESVITNLKSTNRIQFMNNTKNASPLPISTQNGVDPTELANILMKQADKLNLKHHHENHKTKQKVSKQSGIFGLFTNQTLPYLLLAGGGAAAAAVYGYTRIKK